MQIRDKEKEITDSIEKYKTEDKLYRNGRNEAND